MNYLTKLIEPMNLVFVAMAGASIYLTTVGTMDVKDFGGLALMAFAYFFGESQGKRRTEEILGARFDK